MIKKIFISLVAIVATLSTINTASAQDYGWTAGGRVSIYSGWNGAVGVGVYARHGIADIFRIEPSFTILCETGMSIEAAADLQYPIGICEGFEAYPLAGVSFNDPGKFGVGINFGGGLGYSISNRLSADFGVKWILQTQKYVSNPVVFSLGCGYKF